MDSHKPRDRYPRWIERIAALHLTSLSTRHRWLLTVFALAIVAGAVLTLRKLGISIDSIRGGPLLFAFLISGVSPLLTAAEYKLGLTLSRRDSGWTPALQVSVYGSIANVLPVPGGLAVKLKAMTEEGVRLSRAFGASAVTGLVWLSVSALFLGVAAPTARVTSLAVAATFSVGVIVMLRVGRFPLLPAAQLLALEAMFVASAALRFYLVLTALGATPSSMQSVALSASGPLSSALGLIPGALGIYEAISAGIAEMVGVTAALGFVASVLLRLLTFGALVVWIPFLRSRPNQLETKAS